MDINIDNLDDITQTKYKEFKEKVEELGYTTRNLPTEKIVGESIIR